MGSLYFSTKLPQYLLKDDKKAENMTKYDLILENNGSKEHFVYSGLTDNAPAKLFYEFEVELDIPEGEYTYCVLINNRSDVSYEFKTPVQETIIHTEEGDAVLRDLQPDTGLLRVGSKVTFDNMYDDTDTDNLIFYYDN